MKKIDIVSLSVLFILIFFSPVLAWDNKITHKDLSKYAADSSILRTCNNGEDQNCNYLKNIGFNGGLLEILEWNGNSTIKKGKVEDWLREGGQLEDVPVTRSKNHFHNPLKSWDQAGLNDFPYYGESMVLWTQDAANEWSWKRTRDFFVNALTSQFDADRQANFAQMFRGLGQQMHLIQDYFSSKY